MPVKFDKNNSNTEYNDLLKDLGIIDNNNKSEKKNIKWIFKTKMILQNKYQMMS